MKKRQGFTLMELLLVIAILAIVAAVAAPQFFRSGEQAMTDARVALLKANYASIKAAINMRVWDEKNNRDNIGAKLESKGTNGTVSETGSMIRLLVDKGYIQENAGYTEDKMGNKLKFTVRLNTDAATAMPADPYTSVASSPIFMEQTQQFVVGLKSAADVNITTFGTTLDDALKSGKNWQEIYALIP